MKTKLLNRETISSVMFCSSLLSVVAVPTSGISFTSPIEQADNFIERKHSVSTMNIPQQHITLMYKTENYTYTMEKPKVKASVIEMFNEGAQNTVLESGKRTINVLPSTFSIAQRQPILTDNEKEVTDLDVFVKKSNNVGHIQSTFNVSKRNSRPLS